MPDDQEAQRSRYERGQELLSGMHGTGGAAVMAALDGVAPDFARLIVEFAYGDVHGRPGLSRRERQIATIAALTALGHATPQLKVHVEAGLNAGLSREEVVEIIMQMAVYAGFPAAVNGLLAAKEVFAAREEGETRPKA